MTPAAARRRLRQRLLVVFLIVMIVPYARQITESPTLGQDFRAFFAAATVVAHGGDPYDWPTLARTEYQLYDKPQQLKPGEQAFYEFLAYPEGPWLAFFLAPLTGLPWQLADAIYVALLAVLLAVTGFALFGLLGWSGRRRWLATVCTVLSGIGFINLFMGQVSVVVFGAFIAAWWLAARGHGWWAGLLLALVWLKPNIGLPIPAVVALLQPTVGRRLLGGFLAASAALFGAAWLVLGTAFLEWPLQIPKMWQAVQGIQPDMASVESFFYPGLSGWPKTAALLITLAAGASYAAWAMRTAPDSQSRGLTLLLIWLAALPFVQSYDMILLLPMVAVLLGSRLDGWRDPLVEACIWALTIVPLFYFLGFRLGFFNGFTAVPVALLVFAWHRHVLSRPPVTHVEAIAA